MNKYILVLWIWILNCMEPYLRSLVSCSLYTTIIRQKRIPETWNHWLQISIHAIKYSQKLIYIYLLYIYIYIYMCVCVCVCVHALKIEYCWVPRKNCTPGKQDSYLSKPSATGKNWHKSNYFKALVWESDISFLRSVQLFDLNLKKNIRWIKTFLEWISTKWNASSVNQDLNSDCRYHF